MTLTQLCALSTIFSTEAYASEWGNQSSRYENERHDMHGHHGRRHADREEVLRFAQFADNLENEGMSALDRVPFTMVGEAPGEARVPPQVALGAGAFVFGFWVGAAAGCALFHLEGESEAQCRKDFLDATVEAAGEAASSLAGFFRDLANAIKCGAAEGATNSAQLRTMPRVQTYVQLANLLDSFQFNGMDVHQQLVARATLPEKIIFRKQLAKFMGGGTFIGSRAFGGRVLDVAGKPIPGSFVQIGIFIKNDGNVLFIPITYFAKPADMIAAGVIEWDLEPIVTKGTFRTTGLRLFASDPGATSLPQTSPGK
jgi:hypothetical protein